MLHFFKELLSFCDIHFWKFVTYNLQIINFDTRGIKEGVLRNGISNPMRPISHLELEQVTFEKNYITVIFFRLVLLLTESYCWYNSIFLQRKYTHKKNIFRKKNSYLLCKWWCITLTGSTGFWSNRLVFVALSTTVRLFGVIFITGRWRIRHIQILNPIVFLKQFIII